MVLIKSSGAEGLCYIETKNLDGETNLKHKNAPKELNDHFKTEEELKWFYVERESLSDDFGEITCEVPNN